MTQPTAPQDHNVSDATKSAITSHLEHRQLEPKLQDNMQMMQTWLFQLAQNLHTQLICLEPKDNDLTIIMLTPVVIKDHAEVPIMSSAIASALTPVDIISLPGQLALRIVIRGSRESVADLIDECIVLLRHIATAVCVPAVQLADGQLQFQEAMDTALKSLQPPATE